MLSMNLYQLTYNYQQLLDQAEELDSQAFNDTLESITDEIEDKAVNLAYVIKAIQEDVEVIKKEEKRLKDKRDALDNKVKNLKTYLQNELVKSNVKKIKRPLITVSIQNNKHSVNVLDESSVPLTYKTTPDPVLDKRALLDALKSGEKIEGVELKQTQSLRIR